jgi:predicted RNase H-like HicB family nuclease
VKVREVIQLIETDGWRHVRTRGSHRQFNHPIKRGVVTVAGRFEMKYLVIIEPTSTGFSAYSPDLPGSVSTGATRQECEQNMREAMSFHIEGLREEGEPIPQPGTTAAIVEV